MEQDAKKCFSSDFDTIQGEKNIEDLNAIDKKIMSKIKTNKITTKKGNSKTAGFILMSLIGGAGLGAATFSVGSGLALAYFKATDTAINIPIIIQGMDKVGGMTTLGAITGGILCGC